MTIALTTEADADLNSGMSQANKTRISTQEEGEYILAGTDNKN
jgi:hypothetical protein